MNLSTDRLQGVVIVRIGEARLMYPMLSEFSGAVSSLVADGESKIVIDMSQVTYLDSASIGCLMDLYRQSTQAGGGLKLANVQRRVATMLTMTGTQHFIELHADEAAAVGSFGGMSMRTITTSSGTKISLDGDLLAVLEALYRELTRQHGLDRTFEGTMKEINVLIAQFSDTEREQYLRESLFLNTVTYENEQASAYLDRITGK